jgi:thioredoxin 1
VDIYGAGASNREVDMSESIATLTDATFDEVVGSSDKPILVDFWAEWCGPCKMIAPILEELADEQSERFSIGKLDVDANVATATKFSVMSIPTLLLFKDGEVVARLVGAKPKGALLNEITASL